MAAAWTVLVQLRAVEVEARCVRACVVLADAVARLESPVHAGGVRARLALARDMLGSASEDLTLAASSMKAAELLSLRAAAGNPAVPLRSVEHIPDAGGGGRDVRLALSLLQTARGVAEAARGIVERCRRNLRTADHLLADTGLRVDGLRHRDVTHAVVKSALKRAKVSAVLAVVARWSVSSAV